MATMADLEAELTKVDTAISEALDLGAQYSIAGSHSTTSHTLANLRQHRASLIRRIRQAQGIRSRTYARFG
jgi:hypothetical protein